MVRTRYEINLTDHFGYDNKNSKSIYRSFYIHVNLCVASFHFTIIIWFILAINCLSFMTRIVYMRYTHSLVLIQFLLYKKKIFKFIFVIPLFPHWMVDDKIQKIENPSFCFCTLIIFGKKTTMFLVIKISADFYRILFLCNGSSINHIRCFSVFFLDPFPLPHPHFFIEIKKIFVCIVQNPWHPLPPKMRTLFMDGP